jgi:uncharacterized membrane protein YkvA (DUF1232 family)
MASSLQLEESRLKLELFNEKADLLDDSRFLAWLMKEPRKPDYAKIIAGDWLAYLRSPGTPTPATTRRRFADASNRPLGGLLF